MAEKLVENRIPLSLAGLVCFESAGKNRQHRLYSIDREWLNSGVTVGVSWEYGGNLHKQPTGVHTEQHGIASTCCSLWNNSWKTIHVSMIRFGFMLCQKAAQFSRKGLQRT